MNDRTFFQTTTFQRIVVATVLVSGIFLLFATSALLFEVVAVKNETIKNREVGCVGRYLNNEAYSPECAPYLPAQTSKDK